MHRTRRTLLVMTTTAMILAGCSSSSESSGSDAPDPGSSVATTSVSDGPTTTTADPTGSTTSGSALSPEAAALASTMQESFSASVALVVDEGQAACVAPRWIETFGTSLDDAGITVTDLEDPAFSPTKLGLNVEQGEAMVDAATDCGIDVVAPYLRGVTAGLNPDQTACVTDGFDADLARSLISRSLADELSPDVQDLYRSCDIET